MELLTGKCKEDFLLWYKDVFSKQYNIHEDGNSLNYMPFSFQYAVLVDFFDYNGILVTIEHTRSFDYRFIISEEKYPVKMENTYDFDIVTLQQARTEAIKKANEIFQK